MSDEDYEVEDPLEDDDDFFDEDDYSIEDDYEYEEEDDEDYEEDLPEDQEVETIHLVGVTNLTITTSCPGTMVGYWIAHQQRQDPPTIQDGT